MVHVVGRHRWIRVCCLVAGLPVGPLAGQVLMDPSDPRFPLAVAVRRVELREAERSALVERLLAAAEGVLTEGGDRTASLARAAALADTLALVDADLQAGRGAVDEARARARAAGVADEEVADLAAGADPLRHPHPIRGHEDALGALARADAAPGGFTTK